MIVTALELRDRGTFIPIMAILMVPDVISTGYEAQRYLLARAGFRGAHCVVVMRMDCHAQIHNQCAYDCHDWDNRTFAVAHNWIEKHFFELKDGDVIDVEFILGETSECKKSERHGG